uniref:WRKY protein n=1 Tax=Salvia miltiorrhiza TaxID=226208 RepID=A0A0D5YA14_SALMI|nr:WRKY protein [Salvia miltiorrhiza]
MENYQGDLTDIIRATGGAETPAAAPDWHFPANPITFSTNPADDFGDPFAHLRDPLIHIDAPPPLPGFFHGSDVIKPSSVDDSNLGHKIIDDEMKRPPNIFSRMLQISPTPKPPLQLPLPCDSPVVVAPTGLKGVAPMLVPNDHTLISPSNSRGCLMESSLQISSPRNTGIRRRKSQAKKVVCIPAPAPANSRPSGEIVPSDLWAWRKYGQKPIKGSPYPRGYYRCSSSKGCSARKQVERSRTDPNMLVITYTSEHNHPWPTQRNALAGSTRSQPSKKSINPKEEQKESGVKEEVDNNEQSYKPALPESQDSFFAEIEADSLDMLFTQGFDDRDTKALDPFGFYDWGHDHTDS